MTTANDTIDRLAGLTDQSPVFATRRQRDKVAIATQACEDLLLGDGLADSLSRAERLVLASEQCRVSGVQALADEYRQRAESLGDALTPALRTVLAQPGAQTGNARLDAALHFVRTLALHPAESDRAALLAMPESGLSIDDTVLVAQLGVSPPTLAPVRGGGRPWGGGGAPPPPPAAEAAAAPFVHPANLPPPGEPLRRNGYTSETLDWTSWLPVLDPATATAEQQAVLDLSHPKARTSDFYLLLARQPRVLSERSQAFNAIMYAPGGLSRAEREVAATAVSRSNGCVYCASVHAQRFEQLAKRNDVMAQMFDDPDTAGTNARERAIIQSSLALTRAPGSFGAAQLQPLRDAGLTDQEILDMLHSAALFGWANRLMLNLGKEKYITP